MARATQSFAASLSFVGGGKVPAYRLEFLTPTPHHPVGSYETIVVPYIEIGRAPTCAVRFSDTVGTVSRKHVTLERYGSDVFLRNLSATNPTLVNGSPLTHTWRLRPGDEFQLSYEGPRLRFTAASAQTAALGTTRRIGMLVNQSVRPYRAVALTVLGLLVSAALVAGYFLYQLNRQTERLAYETQRLQQSNTALNDSLMIAVRANETLKQTVLADKQHLEDQLQATVNQLAARQQQLVQRMQRSRPEEVVAQAMTHVRSSVFYMGISNIRAEVEGKVLVNKSVPENCHCTGFLLDDGRFVTARHCIDAYFYEKDELNLVISLGGKVTYDLYAISSDEKMRFNFTNHDFVVNRTTDYYVREDYNGQTVIRRQAKGYDGTDWAYVQTRRKGNIPIAPDLSTQLKSGTELHCLGYTYGNTFQSLNNDRGLEVLYSKASVAKDGLDNNTIVVSGYGFDNGNSGGPLFVIQGGVAQAVAIVSGGYTNPATGRDDALGSVVPIRNITR